MAGVVTQPETLNRPGRAKVVSTRRANEAFPHCFGAWRNPTLRRGVLRCAAVCCGILRCDAVCCGVMRCASDCCGELRCAADS